MSFGPLLVSHSSESYKSKLVIKIFVACLEVKINIILSKLQTALQIHCIINYCKCRYSRHAHVEMTLIQNGGYFIHCAYRNLKALICHLAVIQPQSIMYISCPVTNVTHCIVSNNYSTEHLSNLIVVQPCGTPICALQSVSYRLQAKCQMSYIWKQIL